MPDLKNLPPKYCFIDAQNIETYFFKKGVEESNKPIRFHHKTLFQYLVNRKKIKSDKVFIFYSSKIKQDKVDLLTKIGFQVVLCNAKKENKDGTDSHNIDTDLVIRSLVEYYEIEDHDVVLITNDGDFVPLVDFYEDRNSKVELIGTSQGAGGISSKLLTPKNSTGKQRIAEYLDSINFNNRSLFQ